MEEHKVMDQPWACAAAEPCAAAVPPLARAAAEPCAAAEAPLDAISATVSSAGNTKKDKIKKSGKMEEKRKVGTKKKEDVQLKEMKDKKSKKKKKSNISSSSSSSSSDSDEDVHGHKKAKTAETWIWWGILGGLVLVIGGALSMVNLSKPQQVDGQGQEKRRIKIESQLPVVLEENKERKKGPGNVPIEPC